MTAKLPLRSTHQLLLLLTLALTAAIAVAEPTGCPGVYRDRLTTTEWVYDQIEDETGSPLEVELTALYIEPGTTVEYFDGSQWLPLDKNSPVSGTAIRFTSGGDGEFRLGTGGGGGCQDEWIGDYEH